MGMRFSSAHALICLLTHAHQSKTYMMTQDTFSTGRRKKNGLSDGSIITDGKTRAVCMV